MHTLNSWAVDAARKLEEDMSELRGRLTELATQIDAGLACTAAELLAIASRITLTDTNQNGLSIPTSKDDDESDPEQTFIQLKSSKSPVDTLIKFDACTKLHHSGKSDKEIADLAGYTPRYVQVLIAHSELPTQIRSMIISEAVSATLAYETWREHKIDAFNILREALEEARDQDCYRVTKVWVIAALERRKARQ